MTDQSPPRFKEIKPYLDEDRDRGFTTPLIRHLVATAVTVAARSVYGAAFSKKCMQSAAATKHLLSRVGISSRMLAGAVCFIKIDAKTKKPIGWTGFWGQEHHIWVMTEFEELVDLSIAALNEHPMTMSSELAPPAIWWPVSLGLPHFFKYLIDIRVDTQEYEGEEAELYKKFIRTIDQEFDNLCANMNPSEFEYPNLLGGEHELKRLLEEGHPYLNAAIDETPKTMPVPNWIIERQDEMMAAFSKGVPVKSRLLQIEGLFKNS